MTGNSHDSAQRVARMERLLKRFEYASADYYQGASEGDPFRREQHMYAWMKGWRRAILEMVQ